VPRLQSAKLRFDARKLTRISTRGNRMDMHGLKSTCKNTFYLILASCGSKFFVSILHASMSRVRIISKEGSALRRPEHSTGDMAARKGAR
jgi:hypothetical protein